MPWIIPGIDRNTIIGRIASGFDFLGYWFSTSGLGIARKTVERMVENVARLYERGAPIERIEAYFLRWWRWVKGGISAQLLSVFQSTVTQLEMGLTRPHGSRVGGLGELNYDLFHGDRCRLPYSYIAHSRL
ncbi:MAG: hypothetical protein F6J90_15345 [Moorea sp. SIOASIH]|uniref:hypothetical protein n=1 Tax=Moorena sp. SIOASIH TaxID=2607817 RepID=UPI0013B91D0C|nr:hypothetical protein [Moorena sp. SIOASIH]NEO37629.1 hypothetical protein [Moorena sp. SIOASIH]